MGHLVELSDTGVELEVHIFDNKRNATLYLEESRGYKFDRHVLWPTTLGLDLYKRDPGERASLRHTVDRMRGGWKVVFWKEEP